MVKQKRSALCVGCTVLSSASSWATTIEPAQGASRSIAPISALFYTFLARGRGFFAIGARARADQRRRATWLN